MYNCIIIDDELHAIESLKRYIEHFEGLNIVGAYTDPIIALNYIASCEPLDLILLDIDMPKINGIELSKELMSRTKKLVFTTGHTKYGYEAFKLEADDYLLKPYTLGEFLLSMNKLFPRGQTPENEQPRIKSFLVKSTEDKQKMLNVRFSDVIAVESKLNYIMIHTTTRKILTYMTLTEIAEILRKHPGFLQFQRSFIIAEDHIDSIMGNSIRMSNGCEMTVGAYYRKEFTVFVQEKLIKTKRR